MNTLNKGGIENVLTSLVIETSSPDVTRTSREKISSHLLDMMLYSGYEMSRQLKPGKTFKVETKAFDLTYEVISTDCFTMNIDSKNVEIPAIELSVNHDVVTSLCGSPVGRHFIMTRITSMILRNNKNLKKI